MAGPKVWAKDRQKWGLDGGSGTGSMKGRGNHVLEGAHPALNTFEGSGSRRTRQWRNGAPDVDGGGKGVLAAFISVMSPTPTPHAITLIL